MDYWWIFELILIDLILYRVGISLAVDVVKGFFCTVCIIASLWFRLTRSGSLQHQARNDRLAGVRVKLSVQSDRYLDSLTSAQPLVSQSLTR